MKIGIPKHWRKLVKNIGCANQNIGWGQKVVKSDKCMGVSQLLGACARAAPHSLRLCSQRRQHSWEREIFNNKW